MIERHSGIGWSDDTVRCLLFRGNKGLARHAGVSVRTLRRRFRRCGITLKGVLGAKRASVVLNLMQSGLSLRQIAFSAGLSSPPALARFVKREFGMTPAKLAKQLRRDGATADTPGTRLRVDDRQQPQAFPVGQDPKPRKSRSYLAKNGVRTPRISTRSLQT